MVLGRSAVCTAAVTDMTVLLAGAKASIEIVALKWPVNGGLSVPKRR